MPTLPLWADLTGLSIIGIAVLFVIIRLLMDWQLSGYRRTMGAISMAHRESELQSMEASFGIEKKVKRELVALHAGIGYHYFGYIEYPVDEKKP